MLWSKLMSVLKQQVNSSSFFIVMTHNSSGNFKLIHFLLSIKGFHQSPNFETFKCSAENLSYSCHFPNHKSFFFSNFPSLLSKCNKALVKKVQNSYLSLKLTCGFKYDMRNLLNLHPTTKK